MMNRLGQPDFTEYMDPTLFEEFCIDVFQGLPDNHTAQRYGVGGQGQHGVDIIIRRADGQVDLAQCKLYRTFTARNVREACAKFLSSKSFWESYSPRRFILVVAADLEATKVQDEINVQAKLFAAAGIELVVWSGKTLYSKARSLNDALLLRTYFREAAWASPGQETITAVTAIYPRLEESFRRQLEVTSQFLSDQAKGELDRTRVALRAGKIESVRAAIADSERILQYIPSEVAAGWLRLNAVTLMRQGNESEARAFAERADKIDPSSEASLRLRAALAFDSEGAEAATAILGDVFEADSLLLKASFQLALQQYDDARRLLDSVTERNVEYYRLAAWLAFVDKRYGDVEKAIEKGLRIEPAAEGLRFVQAVIFYYGTHVEAAWPVFPPDIPRPVDWAFIKTDAVSQGKARESFAIFDELLRRRTSSDPMREALELWRLAALAVNQLEQHSAEQYARELLEGRRCSYLVVEWIIQRDWAIDVSGSIAEIERELAEGSMDWFAVLVVSNSYLSKNQADPAMKLLSQYRDRFTSTSARTAWALYVASASSRNGDYATALATLDQAPGDVAFARISVEAAKARSTKRYDDVLEAIKNVDLTNPFLLLTACEVWADAGRWRDIFERHEQLLRALPNEYSYMLAITAAYNCRELLACAGLISEMRNYTPSLPATARRIDVLVQEGIGRLREAYDRARALAATDNSDATLLDLARLAFALGNRVELHNCAKALLEKELTAEQQLRFAMWLQFDEPNLARTYWHKARAHLKPYLIPNAIDMASRLGIQEGTPELYEQLGELAAEGKYGVAAVPVDALKDKVQQWRRGQAETANLYALGQIPVHFFACTHGIPLSRFYYSELARSERGFLPLATPQTFAIFAAREAVPLSTKHELYLDVTAVLTANYFDILDAVEQTFKRVIVPSNLIPMLQYMRFLSGVMQPNRIEVLDLIDKSERAGALLAAMPGDRPHAVMVEFTDGANNVTWRSVLESLLANGAISEDEFASVRPKLGSLWLEGATRSLSPNAELHFSPAVLESMPDPLIVQRTITHFRASVDINWLERDRSELKDAESRRAVTGYLEKLIEYLEPRVGNRYGVYQAVTNDESDNDSMPTDALAGLLSLEAGDARAVWIDDRFCNAFSTTANGVPVVSILDVIHALNEEGVLKESVRSIYGRLRRANVRWLAVDADEIVELLRASPITNGRVQPTAALIEMRQYFAAAMYGAGVLRSPVRVGPQEAMSLGELPYIIKMRRAVIDSIMAVWKLEGITDPERDAFSSWIYRNLWADIFINNTIWPRKPTRPTARQSFAQFVTALLIGSYPLLKPKGRRQQMMQWIDHEILEVRGFVDEEVLQDIAALLERLAFEAFTKPAIDAPGAEQYMVGVLARFIDDLPNRIKLRLNFEGELMRLIGGVASENIDIEGNWINSLEYCKALEVALRFGYAEIPVEGDAPIKITSVEGAVPTVRVEVGEKITNIADTAFEILTRPDPIEVVRSQRALIDASNQTFEHLVANLAQKSPAEILNVLMHRRQESATARYREIYQRIARHQSVNNELLFPFRGASVRDHFRMDLWEPDRSYDEFAQRLLEEEGRDIAMSRVMALPLPLPESIVKNWSEQSEAEQRAYIKHLLRVAHSPTRGWHVARLISLSRVHGSQRLARRIVRRLLESDSRNWFQAFEAMLRWTDRIARYDVEMHSEELRSRLLLEWGHAHEMFLAFTAAGVDLTWIRDQFGEPAGQSIIGEAQVPVDVAAPEEFSVSRFMLFGTVYAMAAVERLETLRGQLEGQLINTVDGTQFPRFTILRDTTLMSNVTGSMLQMTVEREAIISALLGDETAASLRTDALHRRVVEDIASIVQDGEQVVPWLLLGSVVGRSKIYLDCIDALNDALQAFSFIENFKRDRQGGEIMMHTAIMVSRQVRSEGAHLRLLQQLLEIAAWSAKHYEGASFPNPRDAFDEEAATAASWLFQMAVNLMFGGVREPMSMSSLISELIRLWPATAEPYRNVLQRLFETEPLNRGELLSEAILYARAQAA